jgi:hypothetical protein
MCGLDGSVHSLIEIRRFSMRECTDPSNPLMPPPCIVLQPVDATEISAGRLSKLGNAKNTFPPHPGSAFHATPYLDKFPIPHTALMVRSDISLNFRQRGIAALPKMLRPMGYWLRIPPRPELAECAHISILSYRAFSRKVSLACMYKHFQYLPPDCHTASHQTINRTLDRPWDN